jgi:geranylgeranyl diphosphate synthase type II
MYYSVMNGGKRLRPNLMAEMYLLLGGEEDCIRPFMAAIEMIHSYSLVHDDLPAMDNDTLRRGKPTTWSVYGGDVGILAGDGLLTYAFETAAKAFAMTDHPERCARALAVLAEKAGPSGMAGGQSVDVEWTGKTMTPETLDFIYRLKTGALIEASLMIGAILAGADEETVGKAERLGAAVGYAFQIRDDILGAVSTTEELGKTVGLDEQNGKTTYVTLYGLEAAQMKVHELTDEAETLLKELSDGRPSAVLSDLIASLADRNN